jgi:hypothetical protein
VPIIRRNNCIYKTFGTCYSVWMTVWYSILHNGQPSMQRDKYQVSHRYSYFSWWWAHSRPKHVEKINKHSKKTVHQVGFIYKTSTFLCFYTFNSLTNTCRNIGLIYVHFTVLDETGAPSVAAVTFSCGNAIRGFLTRSSNYHIRCYSCVKHQTTEQIIL